MSKAIYFLMLLSIFADYIDVWKLLFTGLISGWVFHKLAARRATNEARRNAAIAFYNGMRAVLLTGGLLPPFDKMPQEPDILPKLWPQLQLLVDDFLPFVHKKQKGAFEQAWTTFMYGKAVKTDGRPDFFHYWQTTGYQKECNQADATFERNLNALLKFATTLMTL